MIATMMVHANALQMLVKQLGEAAANINPEMLEGAINMQMVRYLQVHDQVWK